MEEGKRCKLFLGLVIVIALIVVIANLNKEAWAGSALIPVAVIFGLWMADQAIFRTPSDAAPVISPEKEQILDELEGLWDIVSGYNICLCCTQHKNVIVKGTMLCFSGGGNGAYDQYLYLSRTPAGRLYLDTKGCWIEDWNKATQEIRIKYPLNMTYLIRRPRGWRPSQPPPAVVVLPSWWETMTDANGRVYYKNNYKMITSWTPPTAEQIAEETRERNSQVKGYVEGLPPPAHGPPPAFETSGANAPRRY